MYIVGGYVYTVKGYMYTVGGLRVQSSGPQQLVNVLYYWK